MPVCSYPRRRAISRPIRRRLADSAHLALRRDGILTRAEEITQLPIYHCHGRYSLSRERYNRRLSQFEYGSETGDRSAASPPRLASPRLVSSRRTCARSRAAQVVIFVVLVYSLLSLRSRAGQVCTRKRNDLHSADCQTIFTATCRLHL